MKILMVCLGNICRSPLAEGIMQNLSDQHGLNWRVASAGTGSWHIGKAPDQRSIAAAQVLGYNISHQRAQQFSAVMFAQYDLILVMDQYNFADVRKLANSDEDRAKVKLFLEQDDVIDPYWDNDLFKPVAKQIESRCKEIIAKIS